MFHCVEVKKQLMGVGSLLLLLPCWVQVLNIIYQTSWKIPLAKFLPQNPKY